MGYCYAVIGSGQQGVAAGYDLAKFGDADEVLMFDLDGLQAEMAAQRINNLLKKEVALGYEADVREVGEWPRNFLNRMLEGMNLFISAVPYWYNENLTRLAVKLGVNMVDMGGHTLTTRRQLFFCQRSNNPGISIVPDCGMGPGMNISLALYAMSLLDVPREVLIYDGGLPQNPQPPLNYFCNFSIEGLLNEYSGKAFFIRNGDVVQVSALSDIEIIDFGPEIGALEAFVTSGGLSTAPWTFEGKLQRLENKTLRYPGHCSYLKAFRGIGFLDQNRAVEVRNIPEKRMVILSDVLKEVLSPYPFDPEGKKDIGIIRILCTGKKDGKSAQATVQLIDYYDPETRFTAMQRLTGWHASIVGQMAVAGKLPSGAVPIETVSGPAVVTEARKRGFAITEKIEYLL